jgi:hypothetical protein
MGGGLMQLVAYGAQDIYLTGNPQITFFKVVYRRHTNFAMESVAQTFSGSADVGGRAVATVARNGDLVGRMYLEAAGLDHHTNSTSDQNVGALLIDNVKVEIGGQEIDKQTGAWMNTWAELTEPNPTGAGASTDKTLFQKMAQMGGAGVPTAGRAFIPLQFWFNRNPGLALPLIALQYHEVKVTVQLGTEVAISSDVELWADYIYLDTDERRRFAQVSHEYLIEQVQHQNFSDGKNCDLTFNHPVKELVWTGAWGPTTDGVYSALVAGGKWNLKLNGHDRFAERDVKYFTRAQVWQHHTGHGSVTTADSIAVYSFALKPEEHQPSGTCNFSRIDNAQLKCSAQNAAVDVYAVNYNVLRVMSGMGGLAYSN